MMGSAWPTKTLEEAGVRLLDCEHRTPPAATAGYPYVAIPQIKDGRLDLSDVRRISKPHFHDWTRKTLPRGGDVVLSRRCNPGETAVVPEGLEFALGQNLVLLRADGTKVLPQFLRWLVRSSLWWEQVQRFLNVGAVFDSLRCADVPHFRLPIPSLEEQGAIAEVLGALDDKLDVNNRMNQTLEAMALALFRSWFVDFDPVRAKAEGRQPYGMDAETAALFPSRLVASSEGEIPDGWHVRPVGDVVSVVGGSTPSTKEPAYWEGGTHVWTTPKDLSPLHSHVFLDSERHITNEGLATISSGLLPKGTVLLSSRAPIGYVALADVPTAVNQGFIAMRCDGPLPNQYVLQWTLANLERIKGRANGTTFLEVSKASFRPLPVLVPDKRLLHAFSALTTPLYDIVALTLRESATLTSLRDLLLPKLLSGELRVKDAEAAIAATV